MVVHLAVALEGYEYVKYRNQCRRKVLDVVLLIAY